MEDPPAGEDCAAAEPWSLDLLGVLSPAESPLLFESPLPRLSDELDEEPVEPWEELPESFFFDDVLESLVRDNLCLRLFILKSTMNLLGGL